MAVEIVYFVHGTTDDNERNVATGWGNGTLSTCGLEETRKLSLQLKDIPFDVVFCSDLKQAINSANRIWDSQTKVIQDKRLRECNYEDLTGVGISKLKEIMSNHINKPFLNGESYKEVERRIRYFLENIKRKYDKKKEAILAHHAPQLALEQLHHL